MADEVEALEASRKVMRARCELCEGRDAMGRTRVQHHSVTLIKERLRRRSAETVRAAGDEHPSHASAVPGLLYLLSEPASAVRTSLLTSIPHRR